MEISIPARFAIDHESRDLPTGRFVRQVGNLRIYDCTPEEIAEWLSDARHYSDCAGQGWGMDNAIGLQSSAQATVRRLIKLPADFSAL